MKYFSRVNVCCIVIFLVLAAGCTEEKAKTLQLAAESFRNEADIACMMGEEAIRAAVAMPALTRDEISKKLIDAENFNSEQLELLLSLLGSNEQSKTDLKSVIDTLNLACAAHRQLASIYTDLPQGYLLAKNDVKRAQKHVVNTTMRFVKLAQHFESNPGIGKDNVARIRIIETHKKVKKVEDEKARAALMDSVADELQATKVKEAQKREQILSQFAKAVILGEKLVFASVDYDKLKVADLLDSLREFTVLYGRVTRQETKTQVTIDKINAVEARIKNDSLLSPLLDADIYR